uniref:Uncharacterized protein n=1 Tax=Spongospora subterranea TaxID=70186 RepID=A0A0H5R6U3_9EUKA|eukprot:CRZ09845.1 hypothetical protein [Spongospora subterranea]
MGRTKLSKQRRDERQTRWILVAINGEQPCDTLSEFSNFWAGNASAAAKKVFRRSKSCSSITLAPKDDPDDLVVVDMCSFSFRADSKQQSRRARGFKLLTAIDVVEYNDE